MYQTNADLFFMLFPQSRKSRSPRLFQAQGSVLSQVFAELLLVTMSKLQGKSISVPYYCFSLTRIIGLTQKSISWNSEVRVSFSASQKLSISSCKLCPSTALPIKAAGELQKMKWAVYSMAALWVLSHLFIL